MKNILLYIMVFLLVPGCRQQRKPVLPSLKESYRKNDKKPFGSYVAFRHIEKISNDRYIQTNEQPFDEEWQNMKTYSEDTKFLLYILISKNLELSTSETDAMMEYVKEGNDLFIAADYVDEKLLDSIGCELLREDELISEIAGKMKETFVSMDFGDNYKPPRYQYYYYPFLNSVSKYNAGSIRVLGVNEANKPNYLIFFLGKGRLYLHTAPRAFSNYFLLTANNNHYLDNVASYLRFDAKNIFWDEHYKNKIINKRKRTNSSGLTSSDKGDKKFSSLSVINKNPPLRWAFWLAVLAILCYLFFNMKRRQRIINELKPNMNTTLTFIETVGRLYLQKKNNKNISEKMITYFYEHIRNKYFLNTNNVNKDFIDCLSRNSGVPAETTVKLFDTIAKVQAAVNVSDDELLSLNESLENFYKTRG